MDIYIKSFLSKTKSKQIKHNLTTDGVNINVSGGVERVLKYFLDEFDEFETEFYKYVDKVTQ